MFSFPLDVIEVAVGGVADDIRPDGYSGRGMYGDTCAGIVFDNLTDAFIFFSRLSDACVETADDSNINSISENLPRLVASAQTDSMGRSTIVYFPRWTFC